MGKPPEQLDGADVLCWLVSSQTGFYQFGSVDPHVIVAGMAVARYADSGQVYLFKCDRERQVVQDWDCSSVEDARLLAAQHATSGSLSRFHWAQSSGEYSGKKSTRFPDISS